MFFIRNFVWLIAEAPIDYSLGAFVLGKVFY